jgi:hypothetical protein
MEITMNTKTLMLAVVTALSLGAGSAMAQEGAPSMPTVDYWAAKVSPAVEPGSPMVKIKAGVRAGLFTCLRPGCLGIPARGQGRCSIIAFITGRGVRT